MYPIKKDTAITVPFFVHDVSGNAVTGLSDGSFTKRISKNGAAFGAMTVTITELENGWYSIPLSTSHSDTLGLLSITFTNAGAKQINLQFRIHVRIPDDLAFPTVAGRSVDITATGAAGIDWGNIENKTTVNDLTQTDIQLVGTTTTNTDMRGTDSALLAANAPTNFSDLSITVTTGLVNITQAAADKVWSSATRTLTAISTAIAVSIWNVLESAILTASSIGLKVKNNLNAVLTARTLASADYFDPTADTVANVTTVATTTTNTDMRGTDSAALASVCTEPRLAELDAGNLPADIAAVPTAIENRQEMDSNSVDLNTIITTLGTAGAGLLDLGGMSTAMKAEVLAEVNSALDTAIAELGVGAPTNTPTLRTGLMILYMMAVNDLKGQTSGTDALEVHNAAGTKITQKLITDDGADYVEAKMT